MKSFNFTQFGKYNKEKINAKLDELHKVNKIPDLLGCKILIWWRLLKKRRTSLVDFPTVIGKFRITAVA